MENNGEFSGQLKTQGMRRRWTFRETQSLMECYKARMDEFKPRKKILVYRNIANDLNKLGLLDGPVNAEEIQNKIKSLIRSYKDLTEGKSVDPARLEPFIDDLNAILKSPAGYRVPRKLRKEFKIKFNNIQNDNNILNNDSTTNRDYWEATDTENESTKDEGEERNRTPVLNKLEPIESVIINENERSKTKVQSINDDNLKWERKRKLIEYREDRKDKRLLLKLDFLREKERNKKIRNEQERKWYDQMLNTFNRLINNDGTENVACCSKTVIGNNITIKTEDSE